MLQTLGRGTYGEVWKRDNRTAIKSFAVPSNKMMNETFLTEISISERLKHKNVNTLRDYICNYDVQLTLMELATCDLYTFVEKVEVYSPVLLYLQLLSALNYVHENDVLHRDISPSNILCFISDTEVTVKLADFGISQIGYTALKPFYNYNAYKLRYKAPEVFKCSGYDEKADIWAMGCVFYFICNRRELFEADTKEEYEEELKSYRPIHHSTIGKMLEADPKKRPSVKKLLDMKDNKKAFFKNLKKNSSYIRRKIDHKKTLISYTVTLLKRRELTKEQKMYCLCFVDQLINRYPENCDYNHVAVFLYLSSNYNFSLLNKFTDLRDDKKVFEIVDRMSCDLYRSTPFDYLEILSKSYSPKSKLESYKVLVSLLKKSFVGIESSLLIALYCMKDVCEKVKEKFIHYSIISIEEDTQ